MTYMSEIAITQVRGSLLGSFSFSFGLGNLFNAVGLQILAKVRLPVSNSAGALADCSSDYAVQISERYLLPACPLRVVHPGCCTRPRESSLAIRKRSARSSEAIVGPIDRSGRGL